jgi:hypothetical protein
MVKKAVTKKTVKKTAVKAKASPAVKKPVARKKTAAAVSTKVDYYPNRMTVAVSALAGTLLVLFALIAVLGSQ